MKALVYYHDGGWRVSVAPQFSDEPQGEHELSLHDAKSSKVAVVYAAAKRVAGLVPGGRIPLTIYDQRHWRVAGPRKWQYQGASPRPV